ncbi:phage integrase [Propionigenium maris DSM 9537]|uniref:Phage integrase n=1 Tax=Propionigenium maris DSM 9537 TaxID=1123000 RepID=A0A9W6GNQ7_9FUSO|nr:site-specific integrase [Propionigenium maris]GLI57772.1 phage integrase [Propionigenium maris DSM 9537]
MPAYKDGKKWRARFYYEANGARKQKQKRGFGTKKEAQEWERQFLREATFSMDMKFQSLYKLYMEDMRPRIKEKTFIIKEIIFMQHILPYFGEKSVAEITPLMVRNFQTKLMTVRNPRSRENYKAHYLKKINAQLSSIFNFAVSFHDLKENPCKKAGAPKLDDQKKMNIWTLEEFNRFVNLLKNKPISFTGFNILFWTGIRVGELLALTRKDIDLKKKTINVSKTYAKINGKEIITTPKTKSSVRTVSIPDNLVEILRKYFKRFYSLSQDDRAFDVTAYVFRNDIRRYAHKVNLNHIRTHDLRHSHASMLINNNVNPLAISKRLGHAKVDMTLNTYSHLYPSSEERLLEVLNNQ